MEWIKENVECIVGGIFAIIGGIVGIIKKIKGNKRNIENNNSQNQQQTVNIYAYSQLDSNKANGKIKSQVDIKSTIHILFIDDEKFKMVQILKTMGWRNIEYKKNVVNPDDEVVLSANVIFVDINGVGGEAYRNQGLGLAAAIKQKYPEKKVIIYSAETTGDRFDDDLRKVDKCLPKNAEPIQFSNLIEDMCK